MSDVLHSRDYLERTIETVRVHRDADNSWPQWANIFADEIERLWEAYEPDADEPLPVPPTWEQLDAANQRLIDLNRRFEDLQDAICHIYWLGDYGARVEELIIEAVSPEVRGEWKRRQNPLRKPGRSSECGHSWWVSDCPVCEREKKDALAGQKIS